MQTLKLQAKQRLQSTQQIVAKMDPWASAMFKVIKSVYPKAKADDIAFDGLYIPEGVAEKLETALAKAGYKKVGRTYDTTGIKYEASKTQGLSMIADEDDAMDDGKTWVILNWYDAAYK